MYKKILVPLDGSDFSEHSLKHAKAIATGCNVPEVVLLRVVEPMPAYAELGGDKRVELDRKAEVWTKDYLDKVVERLEKDGVNAKAVVVSGNAAAEILDYSSKNKVDLIIMTTHGNSGMVRWVLGSVTDRVLRHASIPVLAVPPHGVKR